LTFVFILWSGWCSHSPDWWCDESFNIFTSVCSGWRRLLTWLIKWA
jgi:hypothetical protein